MSFEDFQRCLEFLERSRFDQVKLLGGEPTLHPRFGDFLKLALAGPMEVVVFTNGLWPAAVRRLFERSETASVQFVVNVGEAILKNGPQKRLLERTLAVCGSRAQLGFNIYRSDFSLSFLADLIEAGSLKRSVRLGLASPIVGGDNVCLHERDFPTIKNRLMSELEKLEERDILISFDCGFPLCMFEPQDLGRLALITKGFASVCVPVIDVGTDLRVWPCFPLSNVLNVRLADFPNLEALRSFYRTKFESLRPFGQTQECIACKYLRRGQCGGGCFARNLRRWQADDPAILDKLNALVEA